VEGLSVELLVAGLLPPLLSWLNSGYRDFCHFTRPSSSLIKSQARFTSIKVCVLSSWASPLCCGSSCCLSGWFSRTLVLYACFTSSAEALPGTPSALKGSNVGLFSFFLTGFWGFLAGASDELEEDDESLRFC